MNPDQARQHLMIWRPGVDPAKDPELQEALAAARQHPELAAWFERHQAFQAAARNSVRQVQPPPDLADRVLAGARVIPVPFVRRFAPILAPMGAAAVLVLGGLLWFSRARVPTDGGFDIFRQRMVRAALREYRMDLVTSDLAAIRSFLGQRQAPADFELPPALASLPAVGGGLLTWQGRPVSMVCLNSPELGMLYLFIAPTEAVREGAPDAATRVEQVNKLGTASWTRDGKTFLLASSANLDALRALLGLNRPDSAALSAGACSRQARSQSG